MELRLAPLQTARLRLEPLSAETARAILAGDLSGLAAAGLVGYGLAAPSRGQGYGSEAVAAVTEWLLSQPGVRQVRAHTLTSNAPSRRVLEKAGFTYVGLDEGEALYQRD